MPKEPLSRDEIDAAQRREQQQRAREADELEKASSAPKGKTSEQAGNS